MRLRLACANVLLFLFACGGGEEQAARPNGPRLHTASVVPPAFSVTLSAAGSTVLEPAEVIETDTALYLFDRGPDELWYLPFGGSNRTPRLIGNLRKFGQGSAFVVSAHPDGIGVAGVDGRLRLMSPHDPSQLEYSRLASRPLNRPLGLSGTQDGGWIIAHSQIRTWANGTQVSDSAIVSHISPTGEVKRLWVFERVGTARPSTFIVDHMAASGISDTLIIVGASPARVIRVTMSTVTVDTLLDVPARPLTEQDRADLREVGKSTRFPYLQRATLPEAHYAILRARVVGRAIFAVARVDERRFVLDLYCDRRYKATALGDADILDIFPGQRGATVLHELGDEGDVRLDFIPWDTLVGGCAA